MNLLDQSFPFLSESKTEFDELCKDADKLIMKYKKDNMEREIKFRVWIPDYDEMIVLENTGVQKFDCENGFSAMFTADRYTEIWAHENYGVKKDAILMQFTGLKDKNGVDIYEGDIMCWESYRNTKHDTKWVVEFNPNTGYKSWSSTKEDAIVIGNIHEHPSLIK